MIPPGAVFEVRVLGPAGNNKRIDAGYFSDIPHCASFLSSMDMQYKGIYVTPNPVNPDLLGRVNNYVKPWQSTTTEDPEVVRRKWLLVDIDPVRLRDTSSTDAEHDQALLTGRTIAGMLSIMYGWPAPMINDSGNGAHLLYPIDEENTPVARDTISLFLKCLAARYNTPTITVDTSVFNAARIFRLPGTWARKGDSIPSRPYRKARVLVPINHTSLVTLAHLNRFNDTHIHLLPMEQTRNIKKQANEYPDDERKFKQLNDHALRRVRDWVPHFFPTAREYKEGYRVSSEDLGLDFEEDLTIHPFPMGIKYFGISDQDDATEGRRTPISLIVEFCGLGGKDEAARALADVLKAPITEFEAVPMLQPAAYKMDPATLPGTAAPRRKFDFSAIKSLDQLKATHHDEQTFIIDDILPTGNILLAARPKMRKTWLALQLGLAVATGRNFLEWKCNQYEVLYLALEDNERRIKSRMATLQMFDMEQRDLSGFRYWTGGMDYNSQGKLVVTNPEEAARLSATFPRGEAGCDALDEYLDQFPKTKLIVIDTLQHFREASNNRDVYQRDYDAMMPLTKLASRRKVCIMPVTHEKKGLAGMDSADFMEDVTGSAGITGGTDGVMSIKGRRGVQEENESRKLMLSGRDVPREIEIDMSFDAQRGGWLTAARQDVKLAVLALLTNYPYINQKELCTLLPNISQTSVTRVLMQLKMDGTIQQSKYGYSLTR